MPGLARPWCCDDHRSRQRLFTHHPSFGRKKPQQKGRQGDQLKEKKEEEKKKGQVKRRGEELKAVGFGYGIPGDLVQDQEESGNQDPKGDEGVSIIPDPSEKERPAAKNNEIDDKSSFFQMDRLLGG
jgi:hypothetical protein